MGKGLFNYSEYEDGSIRISYEDLGVGGFGSYEAIYKIDQKNRDKLEKLLLTEASGNLKELITEVFGEYLDKKSFAAYCDTNEIEYQLFTWVE